MRYAVVLVLLSAAARAADHPNFTGTWKVTQPAGGEHQIIDHRDGRLRVIQVITDGGGARTLDYSAVIDGPPGPMSARWEGDTLVWELRRAASDGNVLHNRRAIQLSPNGRTITARRTRLSPGPEETWAETWTRQDPVQPTASCFQERDTASTPLARGIAAAKFDQRELAERELLPIIRNSSKSNEAVAARDALIDLYARTGQWTSAQALQSSRTRKMFAQRGDLVVARRAPATLRYAADAESRVEIPVTAAGKPASYLMDTGSAMNLVSQSEAKRLGLKRQNVYANFGDLAGGKFRSWLSVMPVLTIGQTELHNVFFWIADDKQIGRSGIIGIPVLLALQTVRWHADGNIEIGIPPEAADLGRANLCFDQFVPVVQGFYGNSAISFTVDTGNTDSSLFPSFATRFPGAITAGEQTTLAVSGMVGRAQLNNVLVPGVALRFGEWATTMNPLAVSLDHVPTWSEWHHGCAGINLLNHAQTVTFDFGAMRLTLEGKR